MRGNSIDFSMPMLCTLIKLDLIKGVGSGSPTRRCVLILRISRTGLTAFPCWVGCTMIIKKQCKSRRVFLPETRKRGLVECDDHLKGPAFFAFFLYFPFIEKETTSFFSLFARAFPCLFIKQRFVCSRFLRTDVPSSQHRPLVCYREGKKQREEMLGPCAGRPTES